MIIRLKSKQRQCVLLFSQIVSRQKEVWLMRKRMKYCGLRTPQQKKKPLWKLPPVLDSPTLSALPSRSVAAPCLNFCRWIYSFFSPLCSVSFHLKMLKVHPSRVLYKKKKKKVHKRARPLCKTNIKDFRPTFFEGSLAGPYISKCLLLDLKNVSHNTGTDAGGESDDDCLEKLQRMIGFRNVAQDQEHVVCLLHTYVFSSRYLERRVTE